MLLHTQWYGTFILNRMGEGWLVADFVGAQKDSKMIASELISIANGEILDREKEMSERGITHVSEERLKKLVPEAEMVELWDFEVPHAHQKGYPMTLILEANTLKASMKKEEGPMDSNIMSAVGALTDIDSSLNLVKERITEWYSKQWPEFDVKLVDDRNFLSIMASSPYPKGLVDAIRADHPDLSEKIGEISVPEIGEDMDLSGISTLASLAQSLWASREKMETYVEGEMDLVAPNLSKVAGPLVGARLIHSAGRGRKASETWCSFPASVGSLPSREQARQDGPLSCFSCLSGF
jgi:RNA processing factor Prp31